MRVAGRDYGQRPESWKWWARQKDPEIDFGDEDGDRPEAGMEAGGAPTGP